MITWTTPTLMLTVKGVKLENVSVAVTITQGATSYTFEDPNIQYVGCNTVLTVKLTQEQTSTLNPAMAKVQVNWVDDFGNRNATKIKTVSFGDNLLKEVI